MPSRRESRASQSQSRSQPFCLRSILPVRSGQSLTLKIFLGLAAFIPTACEKPPAPPAPAPPEVEVTEVVQQDVPIYREWVAQLNGPINAAITPKVQGYLLTQNYNNGFFVTKGQLLFTIDPRPFIASLDQENAMVAQAEANLSQAQTNVDRDIPLAAQKAIAQMTLDTDRTTLAAQKAALDAAKAQLVQAQLNLEWTKVYSPIDGIAGVASSQIGDLVGTSTKMTTVSKVDPIWAYFSISESDYLLNAAEIDQVIRGRHAKNLPDTVEFIQANGQTYPEKGAIILISREVTSQTGTIQLAAALPNKSASLRPGGFGRIRLNVGILKNAMLIPQAAVIEVQSMYQVVVVGPDNKARFQPIQVGERVGVNWIVQEGLKPGEKVVVEGFMKVREGSPVNPRPWKPAAAEAAAVAGGN
jgi:membrane fusion protein, multidrug efflux system